MSKSITDQLASSLGRRDEAPNIVLAEKISKQDDRVAVKELVSLLEHKSRDIRFDTIKVLYEIGERKPELVVEYVSEFLSALASTDNRMKWGAMSALAAISTDKPKVLAKYLPAIVEAMDTGTVITRDHGIYILSNVAKLKKHHADCMELLLEQIEKAPVNQVPMYAEKTAEVISPPFVSRLIKILKSRKDVLEIPSKQKRIEKLFKVLTKREANS